jgi:HSP20 family molecular chaperone IbpA
MSSQIVPINRTNSNSSNKNDIWFNAFDFAPGQDEHIRWLSRPNQQSVQNKYSQDTEKFRITFDVENFQAEQIKIYIQHHKLTISGVYEERSEGRFMQKQFERTFDLPANADADSMASFITPAHMLVVEIPLNASAQIDNLNINEGANNKRRLSFSLNKYNTSNNQGSLSALNDSSNLTTSGQQVRRTSFSKTTTTTTSNSSDLSPEAAELLRSADTSTGNTSQTYSKQTTERHSSNTGNQLLHSEPNTSSSTSSKHTTLTSSDLANLPIDIPPELLASGGTITIQKRKVSVTKGTDGSTDQGVHVPSTRSNDASLTSSTTTTHSTNQTGSVPIQRSNDTQSSSPSTNTTQSTNQTGSVQIQRSNDTQSSSTTTNNKSSNTLNQQQSNTTERRGSKTISSNNQSRMYTLEEFLQNKTWNPSLVDGSDGKKILYMRLQMKPGTTLNQMKISLNGYDLRVEVDNKTSSECGRQMSEHSYRQVTLFPTCEVDHLKTELKDDGFLHIQVPIKL